jgi:hypothetical protein
VIFRLLDDAGGAAIIVRLKRVLRAWYRQREQLQRTEACLELTASELRKRSDEIRRGEGR